MHARIRRNIPVHHYPNGRLWREKWRRLGLGKSNSLNAYIFLYHPRKRNGFLLANRLKYYQSKVVQLFMSDKDTSEEKLIPLANDPKTAKQIECVLRLAAISLDVDWDNPKDWAEGRGNQVRELAIKIV